MDKLLDASPKPILSLCMIVKNERENLPRCLASVKSYVDEIIVVDTGSQDNTPEIALKYGAKISYFEWCDDFAAARNYAISQAAGEWILMLDADEELVVKSNNFREKLTYKSKIIAYSLSLKDAYDGAKIIGGWHVRLFRNLTDITYVGRFHEFLKYQNQSISQDQCSYLEESLAILHYGYGKGKLLQKHINRNIPLLESIRQEEGLDLMLLHALAEAYQKTQQMEKVKECYSDAWEKLLPSLLDGTRPQEFRSVTTWAYNLGLEALKQKDYETVRLLCHRGLEWCPNFPPLLQLGGITLAELGFLLGAIPYFERCLQLGQDGSYYKGEPFNPNVMTSHAAYNLGCVYMDMQHWQEALAAFELALSFDANFIAAREKIDKIKEVLDTQA
ncbi:glycosyltransferase [Microcoleus sp. FACHB-831]|uniref:glycosyltransferase n=1 Tax=Microcoleus sp. FACHB-831 TaxID=2692827 RepID=UPI001682961D|nr:glycosyltransferase [Microcoleus sp. FACHB-831]MBD1921232.1 glycosyltransferase [Microcoleus sp. FACHB-831]